MTRLAFIALAFAAVAACDPYDPDLGPTPFECGGDDNVCPEGYTCDTATDICQPTEGANIDAAGFTCENDSSLEPNDAPNQAYITPIPNAGLTYALFGLSVCPGTRRRPLQVRRERRGQPRGHGGRPVGSHVAAPRPCSTRAGR
jgi:hypothetical protein